MTPEEIVAKYQKRVDETYKKTDNRITHAWVEGEARSVMVQDIRDAIAEARAPLLHALDAQMCSDGHTQECIRSTGGCSRSCEVLRTVLQLQR